MSFGGADQERETPAEFAPVPDQDSDGFIERAPFGERSPFDPSLPVAAVDTVRGPSGVPLVRRRHRHSWADQRPELPSAIALLRRPTEPVASAPNAPAQVRADLELDGGPPAVLRRVTLPRALSVQHRPEPVLRRHRIAAASPALPDAAVVPSDAALSPSGAAGGPVSAPVARSVGASVAPAHDTAPAGDTTHAHDSALAGETAPAPAGATADEFTPAGVAPTDVTAAAVKPDATVRRIAVDDPAEAAAPTSPFGSTSTTSIPDAADRAARSARSEPAVRSTIAGGPAVERSAPRMRRNRLRHSPIADGPGALLDVVRRSARRPALSADPPVDDASAESSTLADDRSPVGAVDGRIRGAAVRRLPDEGRPRRAATAAAEIADRFMSELSQTIQRRPAPLPMPYRPMADVITPGRRVMLSTDDASRHALRSVGKVAATTDRVIHLDPEPLARHRLDEVIAHELTHVAHPSPTPRFFDDVDDSPEERRAEEVAKIMTSSPIAPGNSRPQPAVQRRPAGSVSQPDVIRRSPATTPPAPSATTSSGASSGSSISADALAARITGRSSPDTVRRRAEGGVTPSGPRPSSAPTTGASNERAPGAGARDDLTRYLDSDAGKAWFEKMLRSNTSLLMSLLEDRIIVEAERRGGRTWRGA